MISNISKIEYEKFCANLKVTFQKFDQINIPIEAETIQELNELKYNEKEMERLYAAYQQRLIELREIFDNYQTIRDQSRKNLRRIQLWFKFTYPKRSAEFFKRHLEHYMKV